MPSHIFTRLGLWKESISSNLAAREAAHRAGDLGEELHSMDYLVYAYLQLEEDGLASYVLHRLETMPALDMSDFKAAYAATAMPIRFAVERQQWSEAAQATSATAVPPQVKAIAVWAQGLGLARGGHAGEANSRIEELVGLERALHAAANEYWATQARILANEVRAWVAEAQHNNDEAVALMRKAADEEDSLEKLPVTPGPIVPAREQLGDLQLEQGHLEAAANEYAAALKAAPGRSGAIRGLEKATSTVHQH